MPSLCSEMKSTDISFIEILKRFSSVSATMLWTLIVKTYMKLIRMRR